ncbi:hypothetical protein HMPREF9162_0402 [Selenomonas sp. oral taxon 137 str. F0430]|nr:hypothetical protein [Selenomonas sp. oral taxon 137]EFR39940.1 hypothetical protein HMPREF9162_0402 [Selenomonas sp. oral taxon 137 str. F0430]
MRDLQEQIDAQAREIVGRKKTHRTSTGDPEGIEYKYKFMLLTM